MRLDDVATTRVQEEWASLRSRSMSGSAAESSLGDNRGTVKR